MMWMISTMERLASSVNIKMSCQDVISTVTNGTGGSMHIEYRCSLNSVRHKSKSGTTLWYWSRKLSSSTLLRCWHQLNSLWAVRVWTPCPLRAPQEICPVLQWVGDSLLQITFLFFCVLLLLFLNQQGITNLPLSQFSVGSGVTCGGHFKILPNL